jgi:hypothetical protein
MKNKTQIVILVSLLIFIFFFAFIPCSIGVVPNKTATKRRLYTDTTKRDSPDKNIKAITDSVNSFNRGLPVEKVYVHIDKPYYNIGDTLWFKSYLLDGVNLTPSKLSGLLYVELDNDSSEVVRRICVPVKQGVGWGQIPLPKTIFREGGYTLRAYTNWMENFGGAYIFSQRFYISVPSETTWLVKSVATLNRVADKDRFQVNIRLIHPDKLLSPVALKKVEVKVYDEQHYIYNEEMQTGLDGSINLSQILKDKADANKVWVQITSLEKEDKYKMVQVPLNLSRDQNIDLQFLPEGGNLVNGLKSTVGFKAIGEDGKSRAVLGAVYDRNGMEVVSFASIHSGMGSFEFTPKAGESYTAKMLKPVVKVMPLPAIAPIGTILHIINEEQGDNLVIRLSGLGNLSADTPAYLTGMSRGVIYYAQKVDRSRPEISVNKKLFPSGIAHFTLFKGKAPINERAVFIDNKDVLNIRITPDKTVYNKRDSVGLNIKVTDKSGFPVQGSFSLAVTDDSQIKTDSAGNNGINTNILLKADLKGNIEDPGYYINRKDKRAWQALDNLMLTQAWTGYDWKDIFAVPSPPRFKVEKKLIVSGLVTNLGKKPVANARILISSQKPSFVTTTITDSAGIYQFANLPDIDTGSFFIQASNSNGKKLAMGEVTVNKFRSLPIPDNLNDQALPWYVNTDSTQVNYLQRQAEKIYEDDYKFTGRVLKEVRIKGKKRKIENSLTARGADYAFDEQEIKQSAVITFYEFLKQKLPGIKVIDVHHMPTLIWNGNLIDVYVDGNLKYLPVKMNLNPTTDELIEQLNSFNIATFKTIEVVLPPYIPPGAPLNLVNIREANFLSEQWDNYLHYRAMVPSAQPQGITTILIRTTSGTGWQRNLVPYAVSYRPLPIMHPQQFYRPRYNIDKLTSSGADYRSTIHWEPNIITDHNGTAKVSFYRSDAIGRYTITMAGVDVTGWIGDAQVKN